MIQPQLPLVLVDNLPFGIYAVDAASYRLVYLNPFLAERYGITGDYTDARCWELLHQGEGPCHHCRLKHLLTSEGQPTGEFIVHEHYNEVDECWYQHHEQVIFWPDGKIVKYSVVVDISATKQIQNSLAEAHAQLALKSRELELLSVTDHLTGLGNRNKLDERLADELVRSRRHGTPFALVLLDIDHFKAVNDTYGHQAGDEVLAEIAAILRNHSRASDVVGRWGGEEFLLLCPETDGNGGMFLAEQLRTSIEAARFPVVGRITASLGVAAFRPGDDGEALLRRADEALYRAKGKGRNRVEAGEEITGGLAPGMR
ncbi:MAG: GGDEF domain-containing protein [Desulfurivibrionaceae bacterium]